MAFIGFEAGAPLAEETKNPKKNIPRAVIGSALLVGLFFVLTTYASTVFFGPNKMSNFLTYNGGNAWIGLAKTIWGGGWVILLIALLNSALACSNGAAMAATRSIWAMGHSGTCRTSSPTPASGGAPLWSPSAPCSEWQRSRRWPSVCCGIR
jgi:amino acid transporter